MSFDHIKSKRYIELNSAYRNRIEYPNPSKFIVNVGQAGQRNTGITAHDPITEGYPVYEFQGLNTITGITLGGTQQVPKATTALDYPDDYFVGSLLKLATGESSVIISWDNFTKKFILETGFNTNVAGVTASIINFTTNQQIFVPGYPSELGNTFVGQYLLDVNILEYRLITEYNVLTKTITVDTPFGGLWAIDDYYEIVSEKAVEDSEAQGTYPTNSTQNSILLNINSPSLDNFYQGQFIRITNEVSDFPYKVYAPGSVITRYDGATKRAYFSPAMDITTISGGDELRYQILNFSHDQYSFLNYNEDDRRGYYRIILDNLILPNRQLSNKYGNYTAFFPYVYVIFSNDNIGTNTLFNSNNPTCTRAVFRCPIIDIPNPELSKFIKVRSSMINVIRFNPYESINFEVLLPDGTLFLTEMQENPSPGRVNEAIQISATISYEKID